MTYWRGLHSLMEPLTTVVEIRAPDSAAWDLLTDTQRWPDWGPSVARVECTDRYIALGSIGRVQTAFGPWLSFEITQFIAGQYWHWRVAGISATGHRVHSLGPSLCRVIFEVPVVAVPYLLVCRVAAQRIRNILEKERRLS
jgi:hypothetical protein